MYGSQRIHRVGSIERLIRTATLRAIFIQFPNFLQYMFKLESNSEATQTTIKPKLQTEDVCEGETDWFPICLK